MNIGALEGEWVNAVSDWFPRFAAVHQPQNEEYDPVAIQNPLTVG